MGQGAQLPVRPQLPNLPETLSLLADLGLSEVALERILVAYAPTFFLWPQERYLPCSVEWYLANCYAVRTEHGKDGRKQHEVVIPEGEVTPERLHEVERKSALGSRPPSLWLAPDKWPGQSGVALEDTPVYAHAKVIMSRTPARRPLALEINYTTVWAYNGSYNLCGFPCFKVGEHVGDVEHVTVRLALRKRAASGASPAQDGPSSKYSIRFSGVWYNSHSNKEGEWRQARRVPLDPVSGRVAVFVADHSHGMYPSPGVVRRIFGAANDVTSGDGPVWRPKRVVRMLGLGYSGDQVPTAESRGSSFRESDDETLPLKLSQRPDPAAAAAAAAATTTKTPASLAPAASPSPVKPSHDSAGALAHYHALPPIKATGGADGALPPALTSAAPSQEGPFPQLLIKGQTLPAAAGGVVAHLGGSPKQEGAEPLQDGPWYEPVLLRDVGAWQLAKASYGTADAPARHGWFSSAEPPVSRTFIQRWLTPWVDGVDSLPDPQDGPHDDASQPAAA